MISILIVLLVSAWLAIGYTAAAFSARRFSTDEKLGACWEARDVAFASFLTLGGVAALLSVLSNQCWGSPLWSWPWYRKSRAS